MPNFIELVKNFLSYLDHRITNRKTNSKTNRKTDSLTLVQQYLSPKHSFGRGNKKKTNSTRTWLELVVAEMVGSLGDNVGEVCVKITEGRSYMYA